MTDTEVTLNWGVTDGISGEGHLNEGPRRPVGGEVLESTHNGGGGGGSMCKGPGVAAGLGGCEEGRVTGGTRVTLVLTALLL